jgi:hypothetical protein
MASRAIWKAVIQFGDVSVPVKLYSAVRDQGVRFHLLHDQDMVRIKQRLANARTGRTVEYEEAVKGCEVDSGMFVILRKKELESLKEQDKAIKAIEARIKETKTTLKERTDELELKLMLKRIGGDDFKAESRDLINQVDAQLADLDAGNKEDKKKITALKKDKDALLARITKTDALLASIGGQLTVDQARRLILKKLSDIARAELERYLNAEKRILVQGVENLWDKYAVSNRVMESQRETTLKSLDGFFAGLRYC